MAKDDGDVDADVEEEAQVQRTLRDPGQATQAMIDEHESNDHAQFRPWCTACVRGRAQDTPSRKVKGGVCREGPASCWYGLCVHDR